MILVIFSWDWDDCTPWFEEGISPDCGYGQACVITSSQDQDHWVVMETNIQHTTLFFSFVFITPSTMSWNFKSIDISRLIQLTVFFKSFFTCLAFICSFYVYREQERDRESVQRASVWGISKTGQAKRKEPYHFGMMLLPLFVITFWALGEMKS